jgi:hypothetical protein
VSVRFTSKPLRSIFDLADLYASLNGAQRERLMNDIRGGLDLWTKQPSRVRWFYRLCGRLKWVDDDKGLVHVHVRMTEDGESLFSTSVKMTDGGTA